MAPSLETIEILAREAYAELPQEFRALCGEIVFAVAEFATEDVLRDLEIEDPFDLMGLFEGHGMAALIEAQTGQHPNRIFLYRRAMLDYWCEHEESLRAVVAHVLIHEIGHHFGLSDADMEALEAQADEGAGEGTDAQGGAGA
ncbi:MAG: metallopeptidase family protein [Pseudomonadota bacterium]